ncbi:DNA primase [Neoactinobaculum massilliense]|uniref:DNA primase n=1 Tax=Neoactinobaculum massilliense TaxID=2364794 RepID=UPI000F51F071|nr:DNA primase [Neoactinobaculum massilliense]
MAGLIKREDIERVRTEVPIADVVAEYVQLKPAGVDSLKGLCPFHDEKTPSFHVRPHVGRYHCFGCGEGGDVISFVEKIENITFVEAVEMLAQKAGIEIHYEQGTQREHRPGEPTKARLIDAHRVAVQFYRQQFDSPAGKAARDMIRERGFDEAAVERFQIGYSPDSWDALLTELRRHKFTDAEILASGLAIQGNRGPYDRFRGRVMWPIYSITNDPIGFGARRLGNDDSGPKYLNTPETPIYKKSQVLYGLNLAKKDITRQSKVVVVEGYTDVMAAQLAGVTTAVATCGTAFGEGHVKIVRRLIGDTATSAAGLQLASGRSYGGEVIFTFDGDAAGQKAALRAFGEDQQFAAQTFVAVAANGMDPCDVRMKLGDEALRNVIESRRPLFEFAITSVLKGVPLDTAEGRTAGLRMAAPIVAHIRDRVLRGEYTRSLAGWLGMEEIVVRAAVREAARTPLPEPDRILPPKEQEAAPRPQLPPRREVRNPVARVEREALDVYIQLPELAWKAEMDRLPIGTFLDPTHQAIHDAIRAAGGAHTYIERREALIAQGEDADAAARAASEYYVQTIAENAGPTLESVVNQLAVEDLPETDASRLDRYAWGIVMSLIRQGVVRQIGQVRSRLQRTEQGTDEANQLFARLMELEAQRREVDAQLG